MGGAPIDFEALLGGEDKLTIEQLNTVLDTFDNTIEKVTENQPDVLEHRALLFWEFFEVLMQCSREVSGALGTPLHEAIPAFVQTCLAVMGIVDDYGEQKPPP